MRPHLARLLALTALAVATGSGCAGSSPATTTPPSRDTALALDLLPPTLELCTYPLPGTRVLGAFYDLTPLLQRVNGLTLRSTHQGTGVQAVVTNSFGLPAFNLYIVVRDNPPSRAVMPSGTFEVAGQPFAYWRLGNLPLNSTASVTMRFTGRVDPSRLGVQVCGQLVGGP